MTKRRVGRKSPPRLKLKLKLKLQFSTFSFTLQWRCCTVFFYFIRASQSELIACSCRGQGEVIGMERFSPHLRGLIEQATIALA